MNMIIQILIDKIKNIFCKRGYLKSKELKKELIRKNALAKLTEKEK